MQEADGVVIAPIRIVTLPSRRLGEGAGSRSGRGVRRMGQHGGIDLFPAPHEGTLLLRISDAGAFDQQRFLRCVMQGEAESAGLGDEAVGARRMQPVRADIDRLTGEGNGVRTPADTIAGFDEDDVDSPGGAGRARPRCRRRRRR